MSGLGHNVGNQRQVPYVGDGVKFVRFAVKRGMCIRLRDWEPDPAKGATRGIEAGVRPIYARPTPTHQANEHATLGARKSK